VGGPAAAPSRGRDIQAGGEPGGVAAEMSCPRAAKGAEELLEGGNQPLGRWLVGVVGRCAREADPRPRQAGCGRRTRASRAAGGQAVATRASPPLAVMRRRQCRQDRRTAASGRVDAKGDDVLEGPERPGQGLAAAVDVDPARSVGYGCRKRVVAMVDPKPRALARLPKPLAGGRPRRRRRPISSVIPGSAAGQRRARFP
jgi:hypothetical protein